MHKTKLFLTAAITLLFAQRICSQALTIPYFNGWEDPAENAMWTMNSGPNGKVAANRWYISAKEGHTGKHSLLISDLGLSPDTNAVYSANAVNIVAARPIILPQAGYYDLSFAWKCEGQSGTDGLYVAIIAANENVDAIPTVTHAWATGGVSVPYRGAMFTGERYWKTEKTSFYYDGRGAKKLAFLWANGGSVGSDMSVCIDDIQITQSGCGEITGITHSVTDGCVTLNWKNDGNGSSYEVFYDTRHDGGHSGIIRDIKGNSVTTGTLPVGLYNFFVRPVCGQDTGLWHNRGDIIVYHSACVNYTDLTGSNVTCYYGTNNKGTGDRNPYKRTGVINSGEFAMESRHTLNIHRESDPFTGGALKTIPDNEFVSVRLGNWNTGAEAEAISYEINLDSGTNTILLMKYAIVLQVPQGHSPDEQPKFRLEILDGQTDTLINPDCGLIDFYASKDLVNSGWKMYTGHDTIVYKDWSDIGVDLSGYAVGGPTTVKVRLTTYDCSQGAHFGYAYFTLSCRSGRLEGVSCVGSDELKAPYGFNYRWYKAYDKDKVTVSEDIVLDVERTDTATYCCDVISLENPDCYFTLTASLLPHIPVADFVPEWRPENCVNKVVLRNRSRIEAGGKTTDDPVRKMIWIFGDGTTSAERSPVLPAPDEGMTMKVKLKVYGEEDGCVDSAEQTVTVPAIGAVSDTLHRNICEGGKPFVFGGKVYKDAGEFPLASTVSNITGCDSTYILKLTVTDSIVTQIDTVICEGDTLRVGTQKWFTSNDNLSETLESSTGCDSIIIVRLNVKKVTFNHRVTNATGWRRYGSIELTDTAVGATYSIDGTMGGRLDSLSIGKHTLIVYETVDGNRICESVPIEFEIRSECLSANVGEIGEICADDEELSIPFLVDSGRIASYSVTFDAACKQEGFSDITGHPGANGSTVTITIPDSITPGTYSMTISFTDSLCDALTFDIPFTVQYSSEIMRQKWNNVIAVVNAGHNGGYTFDEYRWFVNGVRIHGESGPYLYLGENNAFGTGDEYRVGLVRTGDTAMIISCPLTPEKRTDINGFPISLTATVMNAKSEIGVINVPGKCTVDIYDINGRFLGKEELRADHPYFDAPAHGGVYIVMVNANNGRHPFKIIVTH